MKLNNKGLSIIELIITMALLSVILLFMYRMLSEITFQKENEFFASVNQFQRAEIIDTIEKYIEKDNITGYDLSGQTITLKKDSSKLYTISIQNEKTITIRNGNNNGTPYNTWDIKGGKIDVPRCEEKRIEKDGTKLATINMCTIPVYTTNNQNTKENNNTIDDITFYFINMP